MTYIMEMACKSLAMTFVAAVFATALATASPAAEETCELTAPKTAHLRVAIHCSKKVLQLWKDAELVKEYPIEVGKGGLRKKRSGDHRTPIGEYEVSWMASRCSAAGQRIKDGRSWCRGNKFVDGPTGPALEKLWTDAYGGSEATVISVNYPNEKDLKKGYTGECIHIHAVKRPKGGVLSKSYGCVHMFPKDAQELYEMVSVGAPVKFFP